MIEIGLRKAWALVVFLAVSKQRHSREALATLLWPGSDQKTGRASLRRTLHQLGQLTARPLLAGEPDTLRLATPADIWLDVDAFQAHVAAGLPRAGQDGALDAERLEHLSQAAALYSDDFLSGFSLPDCPAFDEWQFFQVESLRQSLGQVSQRLAQAYAARGEAEPAIAHARRWVSLDPLHEPAQRQLIRLYAQAGQKAAALRQYQECRRLLEAELAVPPQPETTELYDAIRSSRAAPAAAAPLEPAVRYVQSGEVHIAYQVVGAGPVDLVFVGGFVSHLEQLWDEPGMAAFFRHLANGARLILMDKRGVGLSDRVGSPPTLEQTIDDILAVMEAARSERAVLMGVSEGGPACALLAAMYPERVLALILYGTAAKFTRSADYPWALTPDQWNVWLDRLVKGWGGPVDIEFFAPTQAADARLRQRWAHLLRSASSPGGIKAVLEVERDMDVRQVLGGIRVPTLVVHRSGDRMMRVQGGRYLAEHIPGAQYVELPGDDHWWFVGDSASILRPIDAFLQALERQAPPELVLATILATECVGLEPGARDLAHIEPYRALVRRAATRFRGQVTKSDGPVEWATFDGPSRAIRCAAAIREAAGKMGLAGRTGLHTGECQLAGGTLSGAAPLIARRVLEQAAAGEIVITEVVRGLVVGSGFLLVERDKLAAPDNSGAWQLFAVS